LKENNLDLSQQKLNLIEAVELQQLQKSRLVDSLLELDYRIYGDKQTCYKRAWRDGKGVRRSYSAVKLENKTYTSNLSNTKSTKISDSNEKT